MSARRRVSVGGSTRARSGVSSFRPSTQGVIMYLRSGNNLYLVFPTTIKSTQSGLCQSKQCTCMQAKRCVRDYHPC